MAKSVLVNLDMNQNQLLQAVMQAGDAPANPTVGQFYYDSTKKHAYVYNGTVWELMGNVASVVDADFNANSTNAIQNKAVSTGLVKSLDSTSTDSAYTIKGKAANGSEITSVEIPGATKQKAGLLTATDKQNIDNINNKANKSEAIGNLAISGGTTISWTTVDGSSPEPDSITIPNATTTTAGAMSAADKNRLDSITAVDGLAYTDGTTGVNTAIKSGATNVATATILAATNSAYGVVKVDSALKTDSTNPVQNKVINSALGNKADNSTVNTLSEKVSTLESQMVSMPADISAMGGSTSYKLTLKDADGSTLGAGATISQATSTNVGVVKLDSSVTANGANPVTGKAIYDYVGNAIAASDAMIFKGTLGTGGTITALPTTYKTGWTYRVITAGTYAGNVCEVGDLIIALVDRSGSGNVDADWTVAQTNIDGAITSISGTSPVSVSGSGSSRTVSHANSGVTAGTYGSKSAQSPGFGDTANVPYAVVNATGHVTEAGTVAINIPSTTATASAAGLMSAGDKVKLNGLNGIDYFMFEIPVGQTSISRSWGTDLKGYDTVVGHFAFDADFNEVIVDLKDDGKSVTVSIAQPYTSLIRCRVLVM